ncbi:MAG: hypothetical protein M8353_04550 [ANME-2 cluster archaeon]|nr:hypothetical protein [ANME-2 cluster archaeon]
MDISDSQFRHNIKSSLSDITAGFILIIVSVLVFFELFYVLRDPFLNLTLGLLFLFIAYISTDLEGFDNFKEKFLNFDFNGLILGLTLLTVSALGIIGQINLIRWFFFPLIPGFLLIIVAFARIYFKINEPDITINRMSISGFLGGGILLLYSSLLYVNLPSLAWNPLFPVLITGMLYLAMYVNVFPEVRTHEEGMHNVVVWMEDIEGKIANVWKEFESVKFNYKDPEFQKSLEHLDVIYNSLIQIKEINDYVKQSMMLDEEEALANASENTGAPVDISRLGEGIIEPEPEIVKPKKSVKEALNASEFMKLPTEMDSRELESLVSRTAEQILSDKTFQENLQKEFDSEGLSSIIKEAREMRNSLRKTGV